jgi:uncharacterized protein (TIGR03067 family)
LCANPHSDAPPRPGIANKFPDHAQCGAYSVAVQDLPFPASMKGSTHVENLHCEEIAMCWFRLLIVLTSIGVAGSGSPDDAAKKDLKQYQGTWTAVSAVNPDGRKASQDELRATRLVVVGNTFTFTSKDRSVTGKFTLDPTKPSKAIDVLLGDATKQEEKLLGIYQIDGELRRSCFAMPGQQRPKGFSSLETKGCLQLEWKRQSP